MIFTTETTAVLDVVSLRAGPTTILCDVSLTLQRGEFVCVLGPNGAGKSTMLSMMNGTARPTAGTVRLLGTSVWETGERVRARLRARIGTVLQRSEYNPQIPLTTREVVAIGRAGPCGILRALDTQDWRRVDEAIDCLDLAPLAGRVYHTLSGGEQQKTQIARALAQHPRMLLLDEPATGLDIDWQERMISLVDSLFGSADIPVVMTTHHTGHIPPCCNRVVLLSRGRVVFDDAPDAALTAPVLSALYGCRIEVIERNGRRHCHSAGGFAP
ncbi:MAG: ABC transporter ATP-binding protein [bacterium]|nr:ABC transporter ATP-binding protein [Candidatus Sumerlaeota bacterium]